MSPAQTTERPAGTPGRTPDLTLREVTISIPADELAALDVAAREEHVSRSYLVRQAVKAHLKARKR